MSPQVRGNFDERPHWNPWVELRCRNFKAIRWKFRRHLRSLGDTKALRAALPSGIHVDDDLVRRLVAEFSESPDLLDALGSPSARAWAESRLTDPLALRTHFLNERTRARALFAYAWTRLAKPTIVVETGCFTGWDSATILSALGRNDRGHLYTIDLPAREGSFSQVGSDSGLPEGLSPGFLVPDVLRERWSLIIDDSRKALPALLQKVSHVDLFFHDSHHSYTHMMWEYTTAWPFLKDSGLLFSDDISWNTAFWDFAEGVGTQPIIPRHNCNVGALRRP